MSTRTKLTRAGLVLAAATAAATMLPISASAAAAPVEGPDRAYPDSPAGMAQCQHDADLIRDGSNGAWCEKWYNSVDNYWAIGLYTSGSQP